MKNIDEAITHCENKANALRRTAELYNYPHSKDCIEYANEHNQIANWLKELKRLKERSCENCKNYDIHTSDEMPCCKCSQLFNDYFEAKEEQS